jgi:flagellar M-ring protein FliF
MQQLNSTQQIEQQYVRRILDILEPVVGKNNVKAQVSAEMDFSQTESTSEQHRPNQSSDAGVVRSQQVVESTGEQKPPQPTGIPGATSNQPPQNASAPVNGANPAPQAADGQNAVRSASKRESITNYEVDKTVRHTRGSTGSIKRLTAAVVINAPLVAAAPNAAGGATDAATVAAAARGLTAAQQAQLLTLVRETVGYSAERGDSVNLVSTPFVQDEVPADVPLWRQPEVLDMARSLGVPIGLALFGAILLLGLVRPMLKGRKTAAVGGQLNAIEGEQLDRPALAAPALDLSPTQEQVRLEQARQLAKQNPIAVANIVKTWINGEAT